MAEHTMTETERLMLRNRMLAGDASEFVDAALATLLSHHLAPTVEAILATRLARVEAAIVRLDTDDGVTWPRSAEGRFVRDTCTSILGAALAPAQPVSEPSDG